MVDALRQVHRVLAPGGILIDARPDSRVHAYLDRRRPHGFQRFGILRTNRTELASDRASDDAIARVLRDGLFKSRRRGRFWHLVSFGSLAEFRSYLSEHLRFVHRVSWVVGRRTRSRYAAEQFVIRRAVRFEVFDVRYPAG